MDFELQGILATDTVHVADWALSRVLLMDDVRFPWMILVPRRKGLTELHDLSHAEGMVLMEEIKRASAGLKAETGAPKINIGALGNIVPQFHVHVVARNPSDPAWPGPVWGYGAPVRYAPEAREALVARLQGLR